MTSLKEYVDGSYDAKSDQMPTFGLEEWCNLPGRYTFAVATSLPTSGVRVCEFAVMGTKYIRTTPLTDVKVVYTDTSAVLEVENIFSEEALGNVLAIELR